MSSLSLSRPVVAPARNRAAKVAAWMKRARTRRQLARLDPHLLADVGLDAAQAHAEAARFFWD
ncbi:DUF1127 domain-containing protein [Roseobacter sp. HKCCA0434]|uniref:DUF1127 domain-containing protein n=1 Tax=Roseobacter sp. HKCCA0434 TaxID=3079297 RepID=UPI002905C074|nr:DUF1127 domain-containing protein [Roseobacter sp. HKCCA0434]